MKAIWLHTQLGNLLRIKDISQLSISKQNITGVHVLSGWQGTILRKEEIAEHPSKEWLECLRVLLVSAFERRSSTAILYVADCIKEIENAQNSLPEDGKKPPIKEQPIKCHRCQWSSIYSSPEDLKKYADVSGWGWLGEMFFCPACCRDGKAEEAAEKSSFALDGPKPTFVKCHECHQESKFSPSQAKENNWGWVEDTFWCPECVRVAGVEEEKPPIKKSPIIRCDICRRVPIREENDWGIVSAHPQSVVAVLRCPECFLEESEKRLEREPIKEPPNNAILFKCFHCENFVLAIDAKAVRIDGQVLCSRCIEHFPQFTRGNPAKIAPKE